MNSLVLHTFAQKLYELGYGSIKKQLDRRALKKLAAENRRPLLEYIEYDPTGSMECAITDDSQQEKETDGVCQPLSNQSKAVHIDDPRQYATFFLFCDVPSSLGAIHFPQADVHINPEQGLAVLAVTRQPPSYELDGFVQDYHLCPNYKIWTHAFYDSD